MLYGFITKTNSLGGGGMNLHSLWSLKKKLTSQIKRGKTLGHFRVVEVNSGRISEVMIVYNT